MAKFRVIAEKSHGIYSRVAGGRPINPFMIRDIFDPNLRIRMERRIWDEMEARSEADVRAFFEQAQKEGLGAVREFKIVSIERVESGR